MSGIAEILLTMGYAVSGSDLRASAATERLERLGATVYVGHAAGNIGHAAGNIGHAAGNIGHAAGAAAACDVIVTSSAVAKDNPEVVEARARKVPVIQRAEMLAELMRLKYGIAVAGMHGKTTTTSMVAAVLAGGELDPTVVVGGRVDAMGSNARLGSSQYLVAEADESDRSFLKLSPVLAVVTNLDREHMESYKGMEDVEACFVEFMEKVPFYGAVTACVDNAMLREILPRVQRKVYTYGESAEAEFRVRVVPRTEAADPHLKGEMWGTQSFQGVSRFEVVTAGQVLGPFTLHVPGRHNVLNATAAVAVGVQLGIAEEKIVAGLASFSGVDRRFQVRGVAAGVTVVDDYGHHPTEIRATLQAAKECGYGRVLVLFQPHRYTRTRDLMGDFAGAFGDADAVEVLDVYAASEEPIEGVNGESLAGAIRYKKGGGVEYAASMAEAVERLAKAARPGEMVLTLGAGSVSQAGPMLLEALRGRE